MRKIDYDLVIVGGGIAGLTAAIYSARSGYKTLVIEKSYYGGNIVITSEVVNYPGILTTNGYDLTSTVKEQAKQFGSDFYEDNVLNIENIDGVNYIHCENKEITSKTVILATGTTPIKAGFKNEEMFTGRGVSYCATCDAGFFKDKVVYVIGGGLAAREEALYLSKFAKEVNILVRKDKFKDKVAADLKISSTPNIKILFNTQVVEITGARTPNRIVLLNNLTNETKEIISDDFFGVFVFVGSRADTQKFENIVDTDQYGYILTDLVTLETKTRGIFAAGDVRQKRLRQLVTAASDGAISATEAAKYIENGGE